MNDNEINKDFLQNAKLCFKKARKITRGIENVTPYIKYKHNLKSLLKLHCQTISFNLISTILM